HIFVWKDAIPALAPNSLRVHTGDENEAYRETFSDHFAVTVDVLIAPDNGATLNDALAITDSEERAMVLGGLADEVRDRTEAGEQPEDIDQEPIVVNAEVFNDDFERILAPRVSGDGAADDDAGGQ